MALPYNYTTLPYYPTSYPTLLFPTLYPKVDGSTLHLPYTYPTLLYPTPYPKVDGSNLHLPYPTLLTTLLYPTPYPKKLGCPGRFTHMVRQLHDGMMARVTDNGAVSEAFVGTDGVNQSCILAPTLFSLMISAMLMDVYRDERPGSASPTGWIANSSINGGYTPIRGSSATVQGHSEEIFEATAGQPSNSEDLAQNQSAGRKTVKTGAAIYEANRVAVAKAKRAERK
ncbi:unnamed protein product [Schistocephalus solidus]|uniref:UBC core domain-containing protein n=1 Tax=Schistocephalus solidus TaxID=70667 RepID=A0A183SVT8_SCHSO|nr:unnamed protein product [Schistocephalus solidus]